MESPLLAACQRTQSWPGSELIIVENAAHSTDHAGIFAEILSATAKILHFLQK